MVGIYKITNPNGRIYIGQSIDIESRWKKYYKLSCKDQPSLYYSFKKYGVENHKFEVVEECLVEQLNERETFWGFKLDVLSNKHLNNKLGSGRGTVSEQTRKKISKSSKGISKNKGRKFTEEHKLLISINKLGTKQNRTKIRKDKGHKSVYSQIRLENLKKAKCKPVAQYDLEGNFIKNWNSGKEAANALNIYQPNINLACKTKGKYKGFKWEFV